MLTLESSEFFEFMRQSASLRKERKFAEAIAFVESQIPLMSEECLVNGLLELFKAAWESEDKVKAKEIAERLYKLDPSLPSIKRFLDK